MLLFVNFLFYFSAGKIYPLFIVITATTVYFTGMFISKLEEKKTSFCSKNGLQPKDAGYKEEKKQYKRKIDSKRKRVLVLCLFLNLGILAVVKYTNFAIDNVNVVLDWFGKDGVSYVDMIVPMGISFYTFQAVGYLLDVYWNKAKPQKDYFRFLLFVSFFPQLIQGPISRYNDLSKTLYQEHKFDWKQVRFGLERIMWGYFKKLVVADRIGIAVAALMEDPEYYTGAFVFVGMIFYAIQLYSDFTGGIDITIGIAQCLGIRLEENFIRPFFSKNISEYWRRWHISMGTWFRDYIFYPCCISKPVKSLTNFSKKHFGLGVAKRVPIYVSSILVWLATGIWHGAAWNYVVWGLTNGVVILISQELEPLYKKFHQKFPKLVASSGYKAFQVGRTFLLMCCIRIFDNYGSVKVSVMQFIHMFTEFNLSAVTKSEFIGLGLTLFDYFVVMAAVLVMFCVSLAGRNGSVREKIAKQNYFVRFALFMLLFFAILLLGRYGVGYDSAQFIYNQF